METCITCWYLPNHPRWYDEGIRHTLNEIRAAGFTRPTTELEDGIASYVRDYLLSADPYV